MNKSFADCSKCHLNKNEQHICLTNSKNDLKKVDTLYVTDFAELQKDIEEIANNKKENYLITSVVLCDGENLEKAFDVCKVNSLKFKETCQPKKIICIGNLTKNLFDNCEFYEDKDKFISSLTKDDIVDDIVIDLSQFEHSLEKKDDDTEEVDSDSEELYMYKVPEEYYSDKYRLVDVQYINGKDQIIYLFRDKDNNKIFYEPPRKNSNYYWYESTGNRIIESIDNLQLLIGNYQQRHLGPKCYESDIKIEVKHAVDYYLQSKDEPPIVKKNIFFFDIEVYTYKDHIFPLPDQAKYPISAISFCFDDEPIQTYLFRMSGEIDPKIDQMIAEKKFPNLTVFTDESRMIKQFCKKLNDYQPDFLCGWNINHFDLPYIVGRMKKLRIPMSVFSPYDNVYADYKSGRVIFSGFVVLDQYWLYKELTYTNEPSYTLDAISQKVVGESKEQYEGSLERIYSEDLDRFIRYSIQDVSLLRKLEDSLQHVTLQNELRKAATTTHSGAMSTTGQADGLFMTSMKRKGMAARNAGSPTKEELPGAYVFNPRGGLYSGLLCDFDFTSLYPSIINSWNLGPNTYFGKIDPDIVFDYLYEKDNLKDKKFRFYEDPIHKNSFREINVNELDQIVEENNATINISGCLFKGHNKEESIYYSIIQSLFTDRKKFKKIMFDYKQKGDKTNTQIFDGKQQALKILMNSLYGVLANEHFRFYNNDLASSITLSGQELLKISAVHCNRFMKDESGLDIKFMDTVESSMDYVIYGDTDSIFVNLTDYLKKNNVEVKVGEKVDSEIAKIQGFLNKNLMSIFGKMHRIPSEKSMLELKNEYLFSKYYALNVKKKYAMKVVAQEGRELSFIDIKGLEIKRSDYSKKTQEILQNVLEMILSDDFTITKVNDYVSKMSLEVAEKAQSGDPEVVKSVNFSKPLNQYKTISQHIKAMLMWNAIVNEDFRHGSRGHLFPLKGIDLDKAPEEIKKNYHERFLKKFKPGDLKAIVIPEDVHKLPKYFVPDVKQIVSFSVTDRTNLLLEPLMKKTQDLLLW